MTSYFIVTVIVLVVIGIGSWVMFKRIDDRYK